MKKHGCVYIIKSSPRREGITTILCNSNNGGNTKFGKGIITKIGDIDTETLRTYYVYSGYNDPLEWLFSCGKINLANYKVYRLELKRLFE